MPDASRLPEPAELYVGYLPVPPRQKRFLRWCVPLCLWLVCIASFFWARSQNTPGDAVWEQGTPIKLSGRLVALPYPMLLPLDANHGDTPRAILLVEEGKHGSSKRALELNGHDVAVSGWRLHRDGRDIFELESTPSAILSLSGTASSMPVRPILPAGRITLRGEIVDSKCFLGAMKPGESKTHKDCATLCIRGGIPPMFISRDHVGKITYYLLQSPEGGPVHPDIFPFVADPVEINAEFSVWGGLNILTVSPESIRRL